ncbi:MAG: type I DNA topoisomerase [Candidatus Lernaella stagnicola]|nr:type I DNA topoisomerase [Candidatus Lernaella stagnicola]
MTQSLVIVESPSKAKTISKYLGAGYVVRASVGHVCDLPPKELGVDVDHGFAPKYVTIKGKEKVLTELRKAAKAADRVLLAPDPDREGEAIAWHIAQSLGVKGKPVQRVSFNEITKRAVLAALDNPQELDEDKFNSQQARRILDRLVGYKLSPLLWKKVKRGLSAGRVQSVAVRLVVEREEEIEKFAPQEYWEIFVDLAAGEPPVFTAKLTTKGGKKLAINDGETAQAILDELKRGSYVVAKVARRTQKKRPLPPFITSTLQQAGSRRLRLTPANVMRVAQELYEGIEVGGDGPQGLITYMRTDSVRVAGEAQAAALGYVERTYGKDFLPEKPNVYRSRKGAQEAHEAIRPTSLDLPPEKLKSRLTPRQFKIYELIWKRFIASQMAPAEYAVTTINIENGPYGLVVGEHREIFAGHFAAMRDDDENGRNGDADEDGPEAKLPSLEQSQQLREEKVESQQKFTQPQSRFTEATLIRELEEKGIGRPSTYAAILSTILDKEYVERVKATKKETADQPAGAKKTRGGLRPTDLGRAVTKLLVASFPDILNVSFTARMEDQLDDVETGKVEWQSLLQDFWTAFTVDLEKAEQEMKNLKREGEKTGISCPTCDEGELLIKYGRNGAFLGCSKFPECRHTANFKRDDDGNIVIVEREQMQRAEPIPSDKICPKCGGPMVMKFSRKGSRFYSCEKYPKCKGTLAFETGVACPREGCEGQIVERTGPRGVFWGCNAYPKCRMTFRHEPVSKECPECSSPYLLRQKRDGQSYLVCPVKDCDFAEAETVPDSETEGENATEA